MCVLCSQSGSEVGRTHSRICSPYGTNGPPIHALSPALSVGLALASDLGLPLLAALFLLFFPIANIVDALCAKPNDDDGEQHEDGNQHIEFILSHISLFVFYLQMYGIIVD